MAGIRPQARVTTFTNVHIALVVFIVLTVIFLTGLVILYTQQSRLEQERQAAIDAQNRLASPAELSRFQAFGQRPGQTVLGRLAEERSGMAKAVTGSETEDLGTVSQRIASFYSGIQTAQRITNAAAFKPDSMSLLVGAESLYNSLTAEQERRVQSEADLAQAKGQITQLTQARDEQKRQFDQTIAKVSDDLKGTQDRLEQFRTEQNQLVEDLRRQLTQRSDQMEKQTNQHQAELRQREEDLNKMRTRLDDSLTTLKQIRGTPDVLAAAREADGQVVRALPGSPYVYINLGAKDHVMLGMTFTVYAAGPGIPPSGEGKATVEITTIYDDVSAARIVSRSGNQPVLEGDLVANAVYSKGRAYKFLVVGGFDLDGNGVPDPDGADRVKAMIAEWGGQLVDALDTTTDFVVLGAGPTEPVAPAATASPIDKQRYQDRLQAHQAYQAVVKDARELMLAILNQSQFLHFVGHNLEALRASSAP